MGDRLPDSFRDILGDGACLQCLGQCVLGPGPLPRGSEFASLLPDPPAEGSRCGCFVGFLKGISPQAAFLPGLGRCAWEKRGGTPRAPVQGSGGRGELWSGKLQVPRSPGP